MMSFAVNLLPIKENVFEALGKKNPSSKANVIMTLVLVVMSTLCAWLYQQVIDWLQLVGALAGVMLAFTIPGKF